jgi:hypothetical protein
MYHSSIDDILRWLSAGRGLQNVPLLATGTIMGAAPAIANRLFVEV